MKKFSLTVILLVLGISLLLQGCATVFGSRNNTLVFKSEDALTAKVYIDGSFVGDAPGKIKLEKSKIQHGSKLEIKVEGQPSQEYLILRKQNVFYTLADVFSGGVWLGIDYATGNIYRPSPRVFSYDLKEPSSR